MEIGEAIEHTKNKKGMKVSMSGLVAGVSRERDSDHAGYAYTSNEMQKHFYQAREAWLAGDLETVAEFFGLYV